MLKKVKANVTGSLVTYGPEYSQAFGVEKVATILAQIDAGRKFISLTDYQGKYDADNKLYTVKAVKHIMVSQIIRIEEESRVQYYKIRENGIETGKMVEVAPGVFERTGEETKQEEGTDNG